MVESEDVLELAFRAREALWQRLQEIKNSPAGSRAERKARRSARKQALSDWAAADSRYHRVLAAMGALEAASRELSGEG